MSSSEIYASSLVAESKDQHTVPPLHSNPTLVAQQPAETFPGHRPVIVRVNVGGITYSTTAETLLCVPGSYFHQLTHQITCGEEIFVDRDGSVFQYVLAYLRAKRCKDSLPLAMPESPVDRQRLLVEGQFYNLPELVSGVSSLSGTTTTGKHELDWANEALVEGKKYLQGYSLNEPGLIILRDLALEVLFARKIAPCSALHMRILMFTLTADVVELRFTSKSNYFSKSTFQLDLGGYHTAVTLVEDKQSQTVRAVDKVEFHLVHSFEVKDAQCTACNHCWENPGLRAGFMRSLKALGFKKVDYIVLRGTSSDSTQYHIRLTRA